jgi:dimethylargininase
LERADPSSNRKIGPGRCILALTRPVSASIASCELTHLDRQPIDVGRARAQHRQYEEALAALGCYIERLPEAPDLPDAVFCEDAAVVLDELAVIARPGAISRRPEVDSVAQALGRYRRLATVQAPGTLDGGDVLCVDKTLYVGLSQRSNRVAIEQVRDLLAPLGYAVRGVPVRGCLHLKSAVTRVAKDVLLINRDWVDGSVFGEMALIDVDPSEPYAANALLIDGAVIYAAAYPRTRRRLEERGIAVHSVDVSELAKAEGAVTCCSLIVRC